MINVITGKQIICRITHCMSWLAGTWMDRRDAQSQNHPSLLYLIPQGIQHIHHTYNRTILQRHAFHTSRKVVYPSSKDRSFMYCLKYTYEGAVGMSMVTQSPVPMLVAVLKLESGCLMQRFFWISGGSLHIFGFLPWGTSMRPGVFSLQKITLQLVEGYWKGRWGRGQNLVLLSLLHLPMCSINVSIWCLKRTRVTLIHLLQHLEALEKHNVGV